MLQPGRLKTGRNLLLIIATMGILLLYLMTHLYTKPPSCDADLPGCRQVYMSPSYARLKALDETHTPLASKYSLYLYREQGKDAYPQHDNDGDYLTGIPVLFIPGNAGSYKQARLIAAETSNQYFSGQRGHDGTSSNFDFFTADFNEDFTAFHGRTIVDQAEYLNEAIRFILGLYSSQPVPPTSVILIGHSMGGMVARVMLSLPNYTAKSVNTILTLATPHAAAPLTFDGDILKIYSAVDRFWHEGFSEPPADQEDLQYASMARETLREVSLVSITGGILDNTLPADYTTLSYLVPETHGFTVFTLGIQGVWTPIDHLAIVWCDQLRNVILKVLFSVANRHLPQKTKPLPQRMNIFREILLTGFEKSDKPDESVLAETVKLKLDSRRLKALYSGDKVLRFQPGGSKESAESGPVFNIFNLPVDKQSQSKFLLLSSLEVVDWNELQSSSTNIAPAVLLCSNLAPDSFSENYDSIADYTSDNTKEYIALRCFNAPRAVLVPRSSQDLNSLAESSIGGDRLPFYAIQFEADALKPYDVILVAESPNAHSHDQNHFTVADLSNLNTSRYDLGKDMLTLMRRGADLSLPSSRPLSTNVYIPGAWSSILAYRLKLVKNGKPHDGLFAPFIRQWSEEPFETKWHINLETQRNNDILLSIHGIAPFTPFKVKPDSRHGVNIEIWSDPLTLKGGDGDESLDITLDIDFLNSLKLLILRYRLAIVCYCVLVTLLSFYFQFNYFAQTNSFPNMIYGLSCICSTRTLSVILVLLSLLSPVVKIGWVQRLLNYIDPVVLQDSNEINLSVEKGYRLNSYFLGLEEPHLWLVGPLFFVMAVSMVVAVYYTLLIIGIALSTAFKLIVGGGSGAAVSGNKKLERKKHTSASSIVAGVSTGSTPLPASSSENLTGNGELKEKRLGVPSGGSRTRKGAGRFSMRRLAANFVLLGSIPFFLPYQFAYVICAVVQIISTLRLLCSNNINKNAFNYNLTILILMLWVLPINVPVLIVFVHNFTVNWKTPFSSHHNILAIIPILLLMERHASGISIPRLGGKSSMQINTTFANTRSTVVVTRIIVGFFIFYCVIYGVRHTFWLHHLLNILFCWLVIIYYTHD